MSHIAYVNGQYLPHSLACVHIDDRGYQFADGIYEVILVVNGLLTDSSNHIKRLHNSLKYMEINSPVSDGVLAMIMRRIITENRIKNGIIYIQITRGVAKRDHKFPAHSQPALVITAKSLKYVTQKQIQGVKAITVADQRWARRDIKTIQLLPNCLAKQAAARAGAYEAIMILDDMTISEGASSNVWIVNNKNELITRNPNASILNGVTRRSIQKIAAEYQLTMHEQPFTKAEMMAAKEVFLTSATSIVTGITSIDDMQIGDGQLGLITTKLRDSYINKAKSARI